jgi:hypothetical protein
VGIAFLSGLRKRSQEGARWAWVNLKYVSPLAYRLYELSLAAGMAEDMEWMLAGLY